MSGLKKKDFMKSISIDDEMYSFLVDLSKKMNMQDNRSTADPCFFQVEDTVEVPAPDGVGEEVWVCDGEIALRTEEDEKGAIFEFKEWQLGNAEDEAKFSHLSYSARNNILSNNYTKHNVTMNKKYSNCFFSEESCRAHISMNRHHYEHPVDYLSHASRNPELGMIIRFLKGLTKNI